MWQRNILLALLLLVFVGVNLFVQPMGRGVGDRSETLTMLVIAATFTQPTLIVCWSVLRATRIDWRISTGLFLTLAFSASMAVGTRQNSGGATHEAVLSMFVLPIQFMIPLAVLVYVRSRRGWWLSWNGTDNSSCDKGVQFSLLHVLVWTLAISLYCGAVHWLISTSARPDVPVIRPERAATFMISMLVTSVIALLALLPAWLMLAGGHIRVMVAILSVPLVLTMYGGLYELFEWKSGGGVSSVEIMEAIVCLFSGVCLTSLFTFGILRVAGYRLVKGGFRQSAIETASSIVLPALATSTQHRIRFAAALVLLIAVLLSVAWMAVAGLPARRLAVEQQYWARLGFVAQYADDQLVRLYAYESRTIGDADLIRITDVKSLQYIDVRKSGITDAQADLLRKRLPSGARLIDVHSK